MKRLMVFVLLLMVIAPRDEPCPVRGSRLRPHQLSQRPAALLPTPAAPDPTAKDLRANHQPVQPRRHYVQKHSEHAGALPGTLLVMAQSSPQYPTFIGIRADG